MDLGLQGLFSILVLLLSVWFAWTLLAVVKWDKLLNHPLSRKSIMLKIVIAVVLGHGFGTFILKYFDYSLLLKYFVENS